jgi:hypothetical protein
VNDQVKVQGPNTKELVMRKLQRGAVAAALAAAGLDRVMQAGGQPIGRVSLACELQRSWAC